MNSYEVVYREGQGGGVRRKRVNGPSEVLVRRDFEANGCKVLAIMEKRQKGVLATLKRMLTGGISISLRFGVSAGELALLCEVLKALYSSGVSMLDSLGIIIDETPNAWLRKRLVMVLEDLRAGTDIYTSMSKPRCRRAFPPIMRETIRTGEANGRLDDSLDRLATIFKRASETKRQTISAMMYPTIAFILFIVVCTVIAVKVPEALIDTVGEADMRKVLPRTPGAMQLLFYLRENTIYLILPPALLVGICCLWALGKQFHSTRIALTRIERKVPLLGAIFYQFALVRFLDLLAANNETGIQVTESLKLIRGSVNDALIEDSLVRMRESILTEGAGLGEALNAKAERTVYPGLVRQMVRAGEESGRLTEMLLPIVAFYTDQASASLKRTLDMLTPLMIILLGSVIGPVILAVYKTLILLQEVMAYGV
jgi:type IV pilus assembly protein PilC